jgi:hypothetical protein
MKPTKQSISMSVLCISVAALLVAASARPAQAYEASAVAGGGTVAGTITYKGEVPTRKIIPTKDQDVCGDPREDPLIDVGEGGVVQNAVVFIKEIQKGKAWPAAAKPPELDNVKCRFVPDVQIIPAGPLVVVNDDPVLHNTHGYYGKRTAFNMALPNKGQRIPTELTRAGEVRVDCDAHGWMLGWIYVVDNPYYAITGADGKFTIPDLPPGNYTLVAWQPYTGEMEIPVTISAGKTTDLAIELKKP